MWAHDDSLVRRRDPEPLENPGLALEECLDGVSGFLVSSPEECAQRLVELLKDESLAARIGEAARESVRQRFLLPRLALDYLTVARSQVNGRLPAVSGD